jgi:hypothetical protein
MSTPLGPGQVFCEECGAQNDAKAERCWLCYSKLFTNPKPVPVLAEVVETPPITRWQPGDGASAMQLLSIMVGFLIVIVGAGAFAHDRNLGILYCIVVTPAILIGVVSFLAARKRQTVAMPPGSTPPKVGEFVPSAPPADARPYKVALGSFLMSLAATVGAVLVAAAIAVLIAAAMIIALIAQCFAALGGGH